MWHLRRKNTCFIHGLFNGNKKWVEWCGREEKVLPPLVAVALHLLQFLIQICSSHKIYRNQRIERGLSCRSTIHMLQEEIE